MNLIFIILLLMITSKFAVTSDTNNDINARTPHETQRAQCTVSAGDVRASAEASISKSLEGVCGSYEMKEAFTKLEEKLMNELKIIKEMMESVLQTKNTEYRAKTQVPTSLSVNLKTIKPTIQPHIQSLPSAILLADQPKKEIPKINSDNIQSLKMKPITIQKIARKENSPREAEVKKLNNTMLSGAETKLFAYYWKLDKFMQKLKSNVSVDYSPTFSILGKWLRLKAYFNHLNRDFLYLQLEEHVSSMHEEFKSIFLETGNLFQPLQSKFRFKHKISVLQQTSSSTQDLESQEFSSIDIGFPIPNSALLSNLYIKNDTILIKLIVYL